MVPRAVQPAPQESTPVPRPVELAQGSSTGQAAVPPGADAHAVLDADRKLYLLGFMPQQEVGGLVLGELGESQDLDRIKRLWLPRVNAANQLRQIDERILDDDGMRDAVRELDRDLAPKVEAIEEKLQQYPFWRTNRHSVRLVRLDDLTILQNVVNVDRAALLAKHVAPDVDVSSLLDYSFDFDREPAPIHHKLIGNGTHLFTSPNHDVRLGNIEVRTVPRYRSADVRDVGETPALVIPIMEGDPFIYCVRTYSNAEFPDGTVKRVWFLTLQNGVHRAYALRARGIEYMPMLIIDPETADETRLLMGNWSQERLQQAASPRPPLLKDFFNPALIETFEVRRSLLCVRVAITVEKFTT